MPNPGRGTEIAIFSLSKAPKSMQKLLISMAIPAFSAHFTDTKIKHSDHKNGGLCGQMRHLVGHLRTLKAQKLIFKKVHPSSAIVQWSMADFVSLHHDKKSAEIHIANWRKKTPQLGKLQSIGKERCSKNFLLLTPISLIERKKSEKMVFVRFFVYLCRVLDIPLSALLQNAPAQATIL